MNKLTFLARTSLLIAFFFLIDKILAFVRVGIISRQYADSVEMLDTFNAANNLPDVLFALIFSISFAFAVGVSTFNFGTLVRYKIPLLPFFAVALILILNHAKSERKLAELDSTE